MEQYICLHGHFYQPPRENPWLEEVELQDSAYPYHDWNERITAECYAPNTASRIVDADAKILDLINNYSKISFNIGPTLCAWLELHAPEVLEAIVEADKLSMERFSGHGSAIAQVYNHMIMPLASRADKYTQAYWGILDFERRFGRYPEAMWLPETAVDVETLEVLAELKIRYTILAPRQAHRVRTIGRGGRWQEVGEGVDPTTPYLCNLPSGKSIVLFFYDGPISRDMAFGALLDNGDAFAQRLMGAFTETRSRAQLVHVATDGESYGHHHRHGDMALSYCLHVIEQTADVELSNYGEFLERHPPTHQVEIHENSSWSCVHGVERWRENCGCNTGRPDWQQEWRQPLRQAFDALRDTLAPLFEQEGAAFLTDPWKARNDYLEVVLDRSRENVNRFIQRHALRDLTNDEKIRVLSLFEMQRNCMLMYTSCGWFFDEISGIETTQVLQYAARAVQLGEQLFSVPLEDSLLKTLQQAPSNVLDNGATAYGLYTKNASLDMLRVGAHYGMYSLFTELKPRTNLYCYTVDSESYRKLESGKFGLATGRLFIESTLTWESERLSFAVLHFGDHNVSGGVRPFGGEEDFRRMQDEICAEFDRGHMTEIMQLMLKHFGHNNYSVWHMFRDEQLKVLTGILAESISHANSSLRQIHENNSPVMSFMHGLRHRVPAPLHAVAQHVVHEDLKSLLSEDDPELEELERLIDRITKWSYRLRTEEIEYVAGEWVNNHVTLLAGNPHDLSLLRKIEGVLTLLEKLQLELDVWRAQNEYFSMSRTVLPKEQNKAEGEDPRAREWIRLFLAVGGHLHIRAE
ncbi:MAG: DUF3536 domain-containing protein [Bacteroidota bacterium]